MSDPIDDTERAIGARTIPAGEARTAVMRRRYDAAIEDVWAAVTEPERIARWFVAVKGDLRVGGTFHIDGNASGEIVRCQPPRHLALTWAYGDRPVDEVDVRLTPDGAGPLLELQHATALTAVDMDGQLVSVLWGLGLGWEPALDFALPAYLRGELPDAPASDYELTPEDTARVEAIGRAWAALVEAEGLPGATFEPPG
jgi:uncharacterized protein YndB with AHSA1/START domain